MNKLKRIINKAFPSSGDGFEFLVAMLGLGIFWGGIFYIDNLSKPVKKIDPQEIQREWELKQQEEQESKQRELDSLIESKIASFYDSLRAMSK